MTGTPVYTQDANLSDFTACVATTGSPTQPTQPNYATFIDGWRSELLAENGLTLPYTPTTFTLTATGSPRVIGTWVPPPTGSLPDTSFQPVVVRFSQPVSQILVFPSLDHVDNHSGNGNGSNGWDAYQYAIYGSNNLADWQLLFADEFPQHHSDQPGSNNLADWQLLFDPTSVIGTNNTTGIPESYFTLGTWSGRGPTLVNNKLTPGKGFAGTIGYQAYFDFSATGPYQFYGFTTSNVAFLTGADKELELSAVAQAVPCGVPGLGGGH